MMANVVLQCTVCGQQNTVPRLHSNMLMKEGASTYCSNCNGVTMQRITGATQPTPSPGRQPSPQPANPYERNTATAPSSTTQPPAGYNTYQGGGTAQPQGNTFGGGGSGSSGVPSSSVNQYLQGKQQNSGQMNAGEQQLWRMFETRLKENNLSLQDVYRCDEETQRRLLGTLQFDNNQQNQLIQLIGKQNTLRPQRLTPQPQGAAPNNNSNAGGTTGAVPASGGSHNVPGFSGQAANTGSSQFGGTQSSNVAQPAHNNPSNTYTPNRAQSIHAAARYDNQSAIQGLEIHGDQIIARCSVYPNQPAEYWCAACNVLVSSRCHVQGIHKDHPFISLRLAAEAHIRDLTSWSERCRNQLNVTSSIINNLKHSEGVLQQQTQKQYEALDEHVAQIYQDLLRWKEQLKQDIASQHASQQTSIQHAIEQSEQLHALYSHQLGRCEPLINNIPPAESRDPTSPPPAEIRQDTWALRVLDLVSKLKLINAEPIPMPRVTVPTVVCQSTPSTHMELLKTSYQPLGVRLPDMLDPAFFNFPHAGGQRRLPFTLEGGDDAKSKGILIHNGRTLTRSQDIVPSHVLVSASQVFFSGVTTWDVHIDRLGQGPGRVLVGIVLHGTDGEGVVWDGHRIVGPNEGECRVIDDRFVIQAGTVLRLHLELEPPMCFLHCFINRDGVAKIPLPATGQGWTPAFSVFGPQDQITVTPTSTTQTPGALMPGQQHHQSPSTPPQNLMSSNQQGPMSPETQRQAHLIASLQQQIQSLSERLNNEQNRALMAGQQGQQDPRSPQRVDLPDYSAPRSLGGNQQPNNAAGSGYNRGSPPPGSAAAAPSGLQRAAAPEAPYVSGGRTAYPGAGNERGPSAASSVSNRPTNTLEAYSPELKQLMRYVSDIN